MRILLAVVAVCLTAAVPAEAQIYSWRDASGHLVVSNKPRTTGPVVTYSVAGPSRIRTTTEPPATPATSRYDDLIHQYANEKGLSPDLVRAVIQVESRFNARAVSPKGAMGLMQLMPATARELGVIDPFHPEENIRGGVTYLARLLARYDQNVELALAAYNAGPASVERYGAIPPYRETRDYVKKITGASNPAPAPASKPRIYKWIELVDGVEKVRYSNTPPKDGNYTIVGQR